LSSAGLCREQRVVDAVAGHELLGPGGERLGLFGELGGFGLGQKGSDFVQHPLIGLLCLPRGLASGSGVCGAPGLARWRAQLL
jgi:hypothetical protein